MITTIVNWQLHLPLATFFKFKKQQCAHARRCSDGCVDSCYTVLRGRQRVCFALCFDQDLVVSPWFFTPSSGFWFHSRLILHLPFKLSSCSCVTIQQTSPTKLSSLCFSSWFLSFRIGNLQTMTQDDSQLLLLLLVHPFHLSDVLSKLKFSSPK